MTSPEMVFVDSSNIEAIGYDDAQQELHVQFLSGSTYVYAAVSEETFQELLRADSKGSFFNREVKPNFEHRQV